MGGQELWLSTARGPRHKTVNMGNRAAFDDILVKHSLFQGRRIVQQYDNFPIRQWRMMFLAILDQLNEFDGEFDEQEEASVDANEIAAGSAPEVQI